VCDDTASILDGQYTLFNAMVDDRQMASDTVDMFAGADDYNEDAD